MKKHIRVLSDSVFTTFVVYTNIFRQIGAKYSVK